MAFEMSKEFPTAPWILPISEIFTADLRTLSKLWEFGRDVNESHTLILNFVVWINGREATLRFTSGEQGT